MSRPTSENITSPQRKKPKKKVGRTYFFQPQNNLAFSPNAVVKDNHYVKADESFNTKPPNLENSNYSENLQSEQSQPLPTTTLKDPIPSLQDHVFAKTIDAQHSVSLKAADRSLDQSSDDSFDGVRWRSNHSASKSSKPIFSSPLKRIEAKETPEVAKSMVNQMTDSMLRKYGVGMANSLSQTPLLARTRSEVILNTLNVSPSLNRSKSFDPKSLDLQGSDDTEGSANCELFSGLNKWILQFDDKSGTPIVESEEQRLDLVAPLASTVNKNSEDGLSSDEDAFLVNLRADSIPPLSQVDKSTFTRLGPTMAVNSESVSKPETASDDDADPFSDDLDLLALNTIATQAPTGSSDSRGPHLVPLVPSDPQQDYEETVSPGISFSKPEFSRYQIKSITQSSYQHQRFKRAQLILSVIDSNNVSSKLLVRGEACDLGLRENDIIHVIHTSPENLKLVDDSHNLLIWNPDTLISSTSIADQLFCPRKVVLTRRIAFPGSLSLPLLLGTIVHEIFQSCMINEKFTLEYMDLLLNKQIQQRLIEIFSVGDIVEELRTKARVQLEVVRKWFMLYYKQKPKEIPTNIRQQKVRFSVAEVLDVEEYVWSPMFGIKGIADVTLRANLEGETAIDQFLLPMEIKTAKPQFNHQAQAALYSLLFKDRYNIDISAFLLVYTLEGGSTTKHNISVADLRSLVNMRNRLSRFLKPGNQELPELLKQDKCERCQVQQTCMTLNYMVEQGTSEDSGLANNLYDTLTDHLKENPYYVEFFKYWNDLITKEEEFMSRVNKEIWVMTAKEREKLRGTALGDLVIRKSLDDNYDSSQYLYIFERSGKHPFEPMNTTQLSKYDKVIVSDEDGHFALAQGYVFHVDATSITILTKRRIVASQQKTDFFHRAKVLRPSQQTQVARDSVVFRIDKDEIFYGMGLARYNLLNLFHKDGDFKRRELIVDLRPLKFTAVPQFLINYDDECFNSDQLLAFKQISCAEDYCLIQGMPGTGKTTVISHVIKMLVDAKKTVLLSSYTNSAVDNILIKVAKLGVDFIRVGNPSRIHPEIRDHVIGSESKIIKSIQDFEQELLKPYVIASTCLAIKDYTFNIRDHFDYCIVDEASQVSMPLSLGPLSFCDKFILVGDHFQLPPLVTHTDPKVRLGLSKSLFELLAIEHPQSIVELKYQYRMCEDIMAIPNRLVYDERLKCGNQDVAEQKLKLTNPAGYVPASDFDDSWIKHALNENTHVAFFDHDQIPAFEKATGQNIVNTIEADLVRQTVDALCSCGIDPSQIGIMTLYRSQLKVLLSLFKDVPELEILTADRFQGRDKECIIISMVRSNAEGRAGELMKDWRRINVAATRARSKLIVFGSKFTLSRTESVRDFVSLSIEKGWIYTMKKESYKALYHAKISTKSPSKTKSTTLSPVALKKHAILSNILDDMK